MDHFFSDYVSIVCVDLQSCRRSTIDGVEQWHGGVNSDTEIIRVIKILRLMRVSRLLKLYKLFQ
jgi:hypothetical protein